MKIKDLISIPEVETVIQLNSVLNKDKNKLKKLIDSFVVTEDVEKDLIKVFSSIINQTGAGYFLKGSYGSGKSHFLSALALLLQYPEMRNFILAQTTRLNEFSSRINKKTYIVVKVPLILYNSEAKLEDVVLRAIEAELDELNINVILSDTTKTVDNFFKLTSDYVKKEFDTYLNSINEKGFKKLSIEKQANLIKKFVYKKNIPLQFIYNRNEIFSKLFNIIQNNKYSGLVILIDELSEFLRGKSNSSNVDEDIRFLQFIGEATGNYPLWVIGAIQEELREVSNISDKIFTKLKDRYKNRLELTTTHLEELIEKRLIIKKDGAKESIYKFSEKIEKNFPLMTIDKNRFYKLYPILNPTLILLQSITNIFSKQRGVVDFIHFQIKGDAKRNIPGILDKPLETVITPDKIFDHFENNIQEFIDTNPYYEVVYKYYKNNIPYIFKDKKEQEIALRLIKILILIQIAPSMNSKTVKSIVHMLFHIYNTVDPILNYEYIYKNFIKKFITEMDYIVEKERDNFVNNILSINISVNVNQIINNKYNLMLKSLDNKENLIIEYILKKIDIGFIKFEDSINTIKEKDIYFQNTERKVLTDIQNLNDIVIEDIIKYINSNDDELFIIIGEPSTIDSNIKDTYENLSEDIQKNIIIWEPKKINTSDFETLKKFYAYNMILQQYINSKNPSDKQIISVIKNKINDISDSIRKIIQNSYLNGAFLINGEIKSIDKLDVAVYNYDEVIEYFSNKLFEAKYPLHNKIKPRIKSYNIFQLIETTKKFIIPNEINKLEANLTGITSIIEGILIPLKLSIRQGDKFYLRPSPTKSEFLLDYLSLIPNNSISANEVYTTLRNKGYGVNKTIFILVTSALCASGLITARKNNRLIAPDKFSFKSVSSIGELSQGQIVSSDIHTKFKNIDFIDTKLKNEVFNLDTQNRIWNYIVEYKKNHYNKFLTLENDLPQLERYSFLKDNNVLEKLQDNLQFVINVFNNVKISYNSTDGLTEFINSIDDFNKLNISVNFINKFLNLTSSYLQEYIFFIRYMEKIHIPENFGNLLLQKNVLYAKITDIEAVISSDFESIKTEFKNFQKEYIETYISEHNNYYKEINFSELINIKNRPDYKLLELLNNIKLISVKNDLLNIKEEINLYLRKKCRGVNVDNLYGNKPVCDCGYLLGTEKFKIDIDEIISKIENGIIEYLAELKDSEYFEKLTVYIAGLRQIKKDGLAESLEQILNIDINQPINKIKVLLQQILNIDLINEINKALEGETIIVKRDIREFVNRIVGKNFSKNKLVKIFNDWIIGDADNFNSDNTYVSIIDSEKKSTYLNEKFSREIISLFPQHSITDGIKFLLIIIWLNNFKFNVEKIMFSLTGVSLKNIEIEKLNLLYNEIKNSINPEEYIEISELDRLWDLIEIENKTTEEKINLLKNETIFKTIKFKILKSIISELLINKNKINTFAEDDEVFKILNVIIQLINIYNEQNKFSKITTVDKWVEEVYIKNISRIDFLLNLFTGFNNRYNLVSETLFNQFKKEINSIIKIEENRFALFLNKIGDKNTLANWKARNIKDGDKSVIFLFDGMRWDLWEYFKNILEKSDIRIKNLKENFQYALPPTNTYTQRYGLFHSEYKAEKEITEEDINNPVIFGENSLWLNCAEYDYKKEKIVGALRNNIDTIILGISFIDDKLHSEKFDIVTFYNELGIIFKEKVLPLFEIFDESYVFYIISDHGFKSRINWGKTGDIVYSHSGNSPYEIIIPDIKFKKGV